MKFKQLASPCVAFFTILTLAACGGSGQSGGRGEAGRPGMRGGGTAPGSPAAAVPVRVDTVSRRSISQYLQTNGALEAENEVDIVARTSGPVTEILTAGQSAAISTSSSSNAYALEFNSPPACENLTRRLEVTACSNFRHCSPKLSVGIDAVT